MKLLKTTDAGLMKFADLDAVAGNVLAEMLDVRHDNIMTTIKKVMKYEEKRKSGSLDGRSQIVHIEEEQDINFNAVFMKSEYENRGKMYPTLLMNEDALYLVIANLKGQKAHNLKVWFKSEFNNMKMERDARKAVVDPTKQLNDTLQKLGRLVTGELPESSKGARIYVHIQSNGINKILIGKAGKINRDTLNSTQLKELDWLQTIYDELINKKLEEGFSAEDVRLYMIGLAKALQAA